jgi:hypothetical protein
VLVAIASPSLLVILILKGGSSGSRRMRLITCGTGRCRQ